MTDRLSAMRKIFEEFLKERGGDSSFETKTFGLGPQCDTIPNAQGEFGYDKSNPIPVCSPTGQTEYLGGLRCECGKSLDVRCRGSYGPGPDGHVVDGFELVCKTKKHQITLYMNMYHLGPSSLVPKELRKVDGDRSDSKYGGNS